MHQGNTFFKKLDSIFASFIFVVTGLWFFLLKDGACLRINDLVVPDVVKNGTAPTVVLDCDYSLDNSDVGLVVKWFLNDGDTPVYQWIPPQRPQDLGKLKTLTSNVDTFCPMPQWDSISGADLTGPSPQQDLYDSLVDDSCTREKRSLSVYYPPMVLPPSSLSTWHQCPVPQILTIDSSIMAKPLACKTETLPMCVQMMEIPGSVGTPVCGPMTYEPEFSAEMIQPVAESGGSEGSSAACTAAESEEESSSAEVATEAPKSAEKEEPATESPEKSAPIGGFLSKIFTPSALAELSKMEPNAEGANVKRQTLPELPDDAKPLELNDLKAKLLKDALADPNSPVSSLLSLLSCATKASPPASPPPCSCLPPPPCTSGCSSAYTPPAPPPPPPASHTGPNGLVGLDASVLGPKGLLNLDANVLNLLGLDASVLGPKGLLHLDANVPNLPSSPAPSPPKSSPPTSSDPNALLDLNASVLGPKGLLELDANILKLLGLDLSLLGPKGVLNLDASVPKASPPVPAPPPPPAVLVPPVPKPSSNGGLLGLDASVLGPKGLLDINAHVLKLLGLDLSLLGPKGVLKVDASIPDSIPPAAPLPIPVAPSAPKGKHHGKGGLLDLDASVLGPKGVLDLDANVLNLLGLDLNLLGPKGLLNLDANIPNTPSPSGSPAPDNSLPGKLPLDPTVLKLLIKALGPKVVLLLLSKALSPILLLALIKSLSKPCPPPPKSCPCSPPAPAFIDGIIELDGGLTGSVAPDLDIAVLAPPVLEIPANPIYEIYGNSYAPIMPLCTKTCNLPVCKSVRSASSCSSPLMAVNTVRTFGPLAKLLQVPDATVAPPQVSPLPNPTDPLPQVSTTSIPTDAQLVTEAPNLSEETSQSSSLENTPLSTVLSSMKSLPNSGNCYSLARSLSRLINIPSTIGEPVEESVSTITESMPTTTPPPLPNTTGTNENARDGIPTTSEDTGIQEFPPPVEPEAEFIDPSASTDLPQKMNLLSDSDSSCQRRFLETISQPVLKHFTYQLDLPH